MVVFLKHNYDIIFTKNFQQCIYNLRNEKRLLNLSSLFSNLQFGTIITVVRIRDAWSKCGEASQQVARNTSQAYECEHSTPLLARRTPSNQRFEWSSHNHTDKKKKSTVRVLFLFGRSVEIRTPGLQYPKLARYQLRYTSLLNYTKHFSQLSAALPVVTKALPLQIGFASYSPSYCHSLFLASSSTGCARNRPQLRYTSKTLYSMINSYI